MICYGLHHKFFLIIFQKFKNRKNWLWIIHKKLQFACPRKFWTKSFTGKTTKMKIFTPCPIPHHCKHFLGIFSNKRTNRIFSSISLREFSNGSYRKFKILQSIQFNIFSHRHEPIKIRKHPRLMRIFLSHNGY